MFSGGAATRDAVVAGTVVARSSSDIAAAVSGGEGEEEREGELRFKYSPSPLIGN